MLVTKGMSSGETLLKTKNCTHKTEKGVGKAGVYSVWMLLCGVVKVHDTTSDALLFGYVWPRAKYGNGEPNAVTTVVDSVATLPTRVESSSQLR
jgi:hypothetical protein